MWLTKDNELIINHDSRFGNKKIEKTDFASLKELKLQNGENLPSLQEYLLAGKKDVNTKLIIELKPLSTPVRETIAAEKTISLVKQYQMEEQVEYISFSLHLCKEIKRLDRNAIVLYLNGDLSPAEIKDEGLDGIDYHYKIFKKNPHWIKEAKALNLITNSWTVNDEKVYKELSAAGIDYVTTDIPNLLKDIK